MVINFHVNPRYYVVLCQNGTNHCPARDAAAFAPAQNDWPHMAIDAARVESIKQCGEYTAAVEWSLDRGVRVVAMFCDGKPQEYCTFLHAGNELGFARPIAGLAAEYLDSVYRSVQPVEADPFADMADAAKARDEQATAEAHQEELDKLPPGVGPRSILHCSAHNEQYTYDPSGSYCASCWNEVQANAQGTVAKRSDPWPTR